MICTGSLPLDCPLAWSRLLLWLPVLRAPYVMLPPAAVDTGTYPLCAPCARCTSAPVRASDESDSEPPLPAPLPLLPLLLLPLLAPVCVAVAVLPLPLYAPPPTHADFFRYQANAPGAGV